MEDNSSSSGERLEVLVDDGVAGGGVSGGGFQDRIVYTGTRRGVFDISHHLSHPNCAHEHTSTQIMHIHVRGLAGAHGKDGE